VALVKFTNDVFYSAVNTFATHRMTLDKRSRVRRFQRDPSSTGSQANSFTFTGEQGDATTSLEYLRMRYYDPATGRFISRDPYAGSAGSPLSQNPFAYAEDNPVSNTDPSGLSAEQWACQMRDYTANVGNPFPAGSSAHVNFEGARTRGIKSPLLYRTELGAPATLTATDSKTDTAHQGVASFQA